VLDALQEPAWLRVSRQLDALGLDAPQRQDAGPAGGEQLRGGVWPPLAAGAEQVEDVRRARGEQRVRGAQAGRAPQDVARRPPGAARAPGVERPGRDALLQEQGALLPGVRLRVKDALLRGQGAAPERRRVARPRCDAE